MQISGNTEDIMAHDDLYERFRSFGWYVIDVKDGNDIDQLAAAYEEAGTVKGKPSVVMQEPALWTSAPVVGVSIPITEHATAKS